MLVNHRNTPDSNLEVAGHVVHVAGIPPYVAFLKYWSLLRPVTKRFLAQVDEYFQPEGEDELTGLPIYASIEKPGVSGLRAGEPPDFILVDERGGMTAIYPDTVNKIVDRTLYDAELRAVLAGFTEPIKVLESCHRAGIFLILQEGSKSRFSRSVLAGDVEIDPKAVYPFPVFRREAPQETTPAQHRLWDKWPQEWYHRLPAHTVQTKATCAYDATKEYLENILGVGLGWSDREWYIANDKVTGPGLPMPFTLGVLTELVAPYGVEINRVWVSTGDELNITQEFQEFAARHWADNEMYRMAKGIRPDLPDPRLFVCDTPPANIPLVVMAAPLSENPCGHASFIRPRQTRPGNWRMALDYRRHS